MKQIDVYGKVKDKTTLPGRGQSEFWGSVFLRAEKPFRAFPLLSIDPQPRGSFVGQAVTAERTK